MAGSLAIAVFGMYWDIAIHIDQGRDEGPLANTAHYFILLGLFGIFFAGLLSMTIPIAAARARRRSRSRATGTRRSAGP